MTAPLPPFVFFISGGAGNDGSARAASRRSASAQLGLQRSGVETNPSPLTGQGGTKISQQAGGLVAAAAPAGTTGRDVVGSTAAAAWVARWAVASKGPSMAVRWPAAVTRGSGGGVAARVKYSSGSWAFAGDCFAFAAAARVPQIRSRPYCFLGLLKFSLQKIGTRAIVRGRFLSSKAL